jgi:hypothetical protein
MPQFLPNSSLSISPASAPSPPYAQHTRPCTLYAPQAFRSLHQPSHKSVLPRSLPTDIALTALDPQEVHPVLKTLSWALHFSMWNLAYLLYIVLPSPLHNVSDASCCVLSHVSYTLSLGVPLVSRTLASLSLIPVCWHFLRGSQACSRL